MTLTIAQQEKDLKKAKLDAKGLELQDAAWKIGGIAVGVVLLADVGTELVVGKSLIELIRGK